MSLSLQRCFGRCLFHRRLPVHVSSCPVLVDTSVRRRTLWDRKFIYEREAVMSRLYQRYDLSLEGLSSWVFKGHREQLVLDQTFREARLEALGPDLATATFIIVRKGRVKFIHDDIWVKQSSTGHLPIPNKQTEDNRFLVEGIDASGTELMMIGLDNFGDLKHLKYLNLSNLEYMNDFFLGRLQRFSDTLEFLDISNNAKITDEGLASLHRLRKLKTVNITNCSGLKNAEVVCTFLMDLLPDLIVIGLDAVPEMEEDFTRREIENSRYLNLGEGVKVTDKVLDSGENESDSDIAKEAVNR